MMAAPRLWARLACGGCGNGFTADPEQVPVFAHPGGGRKQPCCLPCWDQRNRLREAMSLPADGRPLAYPEDYPPVL